MLNGKKVLLIFFTVILFIAGFFAGILYQKNVGSISNGGDNDLYSEGWDEAMTRVKQSGRCETANPELSILSIRGKIKKLENSSITVGQNSPLPFDDPDLDERIAIINKDTQLIRREEKDNDLYEQELAAYNENKTGFTNEDNYYTNMPRKYKETPVNISDLKINDVVYIESSKNIRYEKEFTAKIILVE